MERVLGLYLSLDARVISNYLEDPDTGMENLQELQPTVLGTDPHIWQVLHARTDNAATSATRLQRLLYRWAIATGAHGGPMALLARLFVLRAVRRELGLSRLRRAYIGARAAGARRSNAGPQHSASLFSTSTARRRRASHWTRVTAP